jgi:hypothetical protein
VKSLAPRRVRIAGACAVALAALSVAAPSSVMAATTKPARAHGASSRTGRAFPPLAELVKAARKSDRAALERLAGRLGVARLGEAALAVDPATAQAALATIPLARGGVLLVGVVAARLDAPDPAVATAAARTLGALLAGDAAGELAEWEVPVDLVARACGGLLALASRAEAPLPSRLGALDALALARPSCASSDLARLARDREPAVRRATLLALAPGDRATAPALREGLGDPDPGVAAAAAATLCRAVEPPPSLPAPARAKPDASLEAASSSTRALVAANATRPEDAVEMLACLAVTRAPADRALLEKLRQGGAPPVRARAAELLGVAPAAAPGKAE